MTSRDMQIAFIRQISAIDPRLEQPDLPDSDTIFYFINLAQDRYLKQTYLSKTTVKDNIENIQKHIDDLKQLITRASMFQDIINVSEPTNPITPSSPYSAQIKSSADGAMILPLPSNYLYYVRSTSKLSGTYLSLSGKTYFNNKVVDHLDINNSILTNGFNTPIIRTPVVVLETAPPSTSSSPSYLKLYLDSYSNLFNIEITYLRQPKKIVLVVTDSTTQVSTCELTASTHTELITYASSMFIEEYKYKLATKQPGK